MSKIELPVLSAHCQDSINGLTTGSGNDSSTKPKTQSPADVDVEKDFDLSQFHVDDILRNATDRKIITCLGRFVDRSETDVAIVLLEKNPFDERQFRAQKHKLTDEDEGVERNGSGDGEAEDASVGFFSATSTLKKHFTNDIYGTFEMYPNPAINSIKTTIIYPATENHIKKYSTQDIFIFNESPEDYRTKTQPYLESEAFSLDWVYNILEHQQESERIVFEETGDELGFILLPDLKWDGKTVDALYLQAIVHRRDLKSIRDLTADHLPLLRNIRDKGIDTIKAKYGIPGTQLRVYFHYQPSFYHLHIHFTYLKHEAPGIRCERGHLLDTVISNLELMGDYYQRATLPFVVSRQYKLYNLYADVTTDEDKEQKKEAEKIA